MMQIVAEYTLEEWPKIARQIREEAESDFLRVVKEGSFTEALDAFVSYAEEVKVGVDMKELSPADAATILWSATNLLSNNSKRA